MCFPDVSVKGRNVQILRTTWALASPPWIWGRQCVFSETLEIEDASVNHSEVEKEARACGTVGMSCERFLRN